MCSIKAPTRFVLPHASKRVLSYGVVLQVLSPERHSGGEKSVATIMYLLSLQGITNTPFRVVDEINQGMDQTNERKVFQAMVDASKTKVTSQCLLMTLKLIPQLDYGDRVNILDIHNAVHI